VLERHTANVLALLVALCGLLLALHVRSDRRNMARASQPAPTVNTTGLMPIYQTLAERRLLDLTPSFVPTAPHWKDSSEDMLIPLVVLDVHDKVAREPDYVITLDDIVGWERRHGPIPLHALVVIRADWPDDSSNEVERPSRSAETATRHPAWSMVVLRALYLDRHIAGFGRITPRPSLEQIPEYGALALVAFPSPPDSGEAPARVVAILP
jgi:kynurenine formamidase